MVHDVPVVLMVLMSDCLLGPLMPLIPRSLPPRWCVRRRNQKRCVSELRGYFDIVRVLLGTEDVELDARDDCGHTALMLASLRGHLNCMRLLIEAGASDEEVDEVERGVEQSPT